MNRLKAKERLTSASASTGAPSSPGAGPSTSRNGQAYVNKPSAQPATARNMAQEQGKGKGKDEAPLRRDPSLVSHWASVLPGKKLMVNRANTLNTI
jgi:hypothetical protein